MRKYDALQKKWQRFNEESDTSPFNLEKLSPGKFCIRILDEGGVGACRASIETTGYFDSVKDALAFYRFFEIPRILDYDSCSFLEHKDLMAIEEYLDGYNSRFKKELLNLLELIDNTIKSNKISQKTIIEIFQKYNKIFKKTNPKNQILVWGNLTQILKSEHFVNLGDSLDQDELMYLLETGKFRETNKKHLKMAKDFIESCEMYC